MAQHFDTIVLGAGAMGSAAAYHLSKRGQRTLLLEQFEIDHQKGSSYGYSRIIRYSYDYTPYIDLARTVYPMWAAFEEEAGEKLHITTGGLDFGPPGDPVLENTLKAVQTANIPHEILSPVETHYRFPQFQLDEGWSTIYQPDSGLLRASKSVLAHVRLAERYGATTLANTPVTKINVQQNGVEIITQQETYRAARLIITAGGWARTVLAQTDLNLPLTPLRTQEAYFQPKKIADYETQNFPVFMAHLETLYAETFYGLPSVDNSGVKLGVHGGSLVNHPSEIDYSPDLEIIEQVRIFTKHHMPDAAAAPLSSARICLYTMTPDEHFIVDQHPEYPHVVIGAGFSGHGFKFSPLIGSILADLALENTTQHDISLFKVSRFV